MQLRLLLDGTITFVYKNFNENLLESIKNDPVMLGLKDGFSELVPEKPTGMIYKKCTVKREF